MIRPLRIAMLTHSPNPRGSVVHALAVADALTGLGHTVVVHAPANGDDGFFRPTCCATAMVPATPTASGLRDLIATRIADYVRYFTFAEHRQFDVYHAQDGISGNALATLQDQGLIPGFARTVHHVEDFSDPEVAAWQLRSIRAADRHFVVSSLWQDILARDFGLDAVLIGNGVDRTFFTPQRAPGDAALERRLGLGSGPRFLAIGGIEARKNTVNILRAFAQVRTTIPNAQLVIAGGVSLLDHQTYRQEFSAELVRTGISAPQVVLAGRIAHDDLPALYRLADALVFPSVHEGFGLVALEAMACGTPVIISRIAPFTEHFPEPSVECCDPHDAPSIARAMAEALRPAVRARLAAHAPAVLAAHDWLTTARAHLPTYARIMEPTHA